VSLLTTQHVKTTEIYRGAVSRLAFSCGRCSAEVFAGDVFCRCCGAKFTEHIERTVTR
jgi:hypothetical protein